MIDIKLPNNGTCPEPLIVTGNPEDWIIDETINVEQPYKVREIEVDKR